MHILEANSDVTLLTDDELVEEMERLKLVQERLECESLKGFAIYFWDVVEPTVPLKWNWHLDTVCQDLEDLYHGRITRLIENVPPGTMKSLLGSVLFRGWVWSKKPHARFLAGSYGSHLSFRDNQRLRDLVNSDKYQRLFPHVQLMRDAVEKLETTKKGWSIATSVNGVGTGEHPDYTIIDDPLTPKDAVSEAEVKAANDWVDKTLSTRGAARGVKLLLIMQRLAIGDTTDHMASKPIAMRHRIFPMRYIPLRVDEHGVVTDRPDPADIRTQEGELLWPDLLDEQKVHDIEVQLGPYGTAGQLQQRPVPEGGGLFKREWFQYVDAPPANATRKVRGWDTGGTEQAGDPTVGVLISEDTEDRIYIEDVVWAQLEPNGVDDLIYNTAVGDGKDVAQREEREGGSAGKSVITMRAKRLKGYDYQESLTGGKNKYERAKAFRTQCASRNVFLVRAPWNLAYVNELCNFGAGGRDDRVDASSTAYNRLLAEPKKVKKSLVWGAKK